MESSLLRVGFLWLWWVWVTLHCGTWVSHFGGFSCFKAQAVGAEASIVTARGLSICGPRALVSLWHVESSQTRDQTHVPWIGRQILNHWIIMEVWKAIFYCWFYNHLNFTEFSHSFQQYFSCLSWSFLLQIHSNCKKEGENNISSFQIIKLIFSFMSFIGYN